MKEVLNIDEWLKIREKDSQFIFSIPGSDRVVIRLKDSESFCCGEFVLINYKRWNITSFFSDEIYVSLVRMEKKRKIFHCDVEINQLNKI